MMKLAPGQWFMLSKEGYLKGLEHGVMDEELAKERSLMWPDQYIGVVNITEKGQVVAYVPIRVGKDQLKWVEYV